MNTNRSISYPVVSFLTRTGRGLTVVIVLLVALIGLSGWLLYRSLDSTKRAQSDIEAIDATTNDLTTLGYLTDVSGHGLLAGSGDVEQVRVILTQLTKNKCCALDSDLAISSLQWLDHAATVLSGEKQQVRDMPLSVAGYKGVQDDLVKAYESHESLVRNVTGIVVNWDSNFGSVRDANIKAAQDQIETSVTLYTDAQNRLDQTIVDSRQQQDTLGPRRQASQAAITSWHQQSYAFLGGIILGLLIFAGFLVLVVRTRAAATAPLAHAPGTVQPRNRHQKKSN